MRKFLLYDVFTKINNTKTKIVTNQNKEEKVMMKRKCLKLFILTASFALALTPAAGCGQNEPVELVGEVVSQAQVEGESEVASEASSEVTSTNAKPKDEYPAFVPGSGAKKYDPNETPSETEEVTEEASEENGEEVSEEPSETPSETPEYTVTDMEKTLYVQKSVTVREGPSTDYAKLGSLKQNDEVKVTGVASTGWYRFDYNGKTGFCSDKYLGESKVVASNTGGTGTGTDTGNTGDTHEEGEIWIGENGNRYKMVGGQKYMDVGGGAWVAVRQPVTVAYEETYNDMECFNAVNKLREENGLPALAWNTEKEAKARERVTSIGKDGGGHSNPTHAGMSNGENVVASFGKGAFDNYNRSEGHRNAMLSTSYTSCCCVSYRVVLSDGTYGQCMNIIVFFCDNDGTVEY